MKISIAFATFNGEKYIMSQLESLQKQTLLPDEIIFVDDGSSDKTLDILKKFSVSSSIQMKIIINDENLHFTGNFLKAASLCSGEIIVFCDQDDLWHPQKIETCVAEFEKQSADLLVHEGRIINEAGELVNKKIPDLTNIENFFDEPPFDRPSKGFAMLVSKKIITEFLSYWDWDDYLVFRRQYGPPLGHDLLLYAFALHHYKIAFVKEELVYYRIHNNNVTARVGITKNIFYRFFDYFKNLKLNQEGYSKPAKKLTEEVKFIQRYMHRVPPDVELPGINILEDWWHKRSIYYSLRSEIYKNSNNFFQRLGGIKKMLNQGGYSNSETASFGSRSFIKDALIAIFK